MTLLKASSQNPLFSRAAIDHIRRDPSSWSLIGTNTIIIAMALAEGWSLGTAMYIYWWQSVIIGVFNVIRIATLSDFAVKNAKGAPIPAQGLNFAKYFLAGFFAVHYGFFHFGYLAFLSTFAKTTDAWMVLLTTGAFFANHLFSFFYNAQNDAGQADIGKVFMAPYARIVPMHLTIIFGMGFLMFFRNRIAEEIVLVFFMILKTFADVKMHADEHIATGRKNKETPQPQL